MDELKGKIALNILLAGLILAALYLGFIKYQNYQSQKYLNDFRVLKGEQTVEKILSLYKEIIEYQATYKLTPKNSDRLVYELSKTGKQLKEIEEKMRTKHPNEYIDFSYIYQDIYLVVKQIQDKSNDAKLAAMVVHGVEGIGNLKVQLYMSNR